MRKQARKIAGSEVSLDGEVEEREKPRVIHDVPFRGGATVRKREESKEPEEAKGTGGVSVNADTDWHEVPE